MASKYRVRGFNFIEAASQGDTVENFRMCTNLEVVEQPLMVLGEPCAVYQITDKDGDVIGLLENIKVQHPPYKSMLFRTPGLSHVEIEAWVTGSVALEALPDSYTMYLRDPGMCQEITEYLAAFFASDTKGK